MSKHVDYYHFLISPWSYLAISRFNQLKERTGITVDYLPIDVGSTFAEMGGVPPAKRHPSRQRLRMDELKRWSSYLDIPMNLTPSFFPADQTQAACMLYAADPAQRSVLSDALLRAVWRDDQDIANPDTLSCIASDCGCDAAQLLEKAANPAIKEHFMSITRQAHALEVFGSPSYVHAGEIFWGQDRLDFLERALQN